MIVLHDSTNPTSVLFVASHTGPGDSVYDFAGAGKSEWLRVGGLWNRERLPAVVIDVPAYTARVFDRNGVMVKTRTISARQYVISVRDMNDVDAALARVNAFIDDSASLGNDKPRLSRATMNSAPVGRSQ